MAELVSDYVDEMVFGLNLVKQWTLTDSGRHFSERYRLKTMLLIPTLPYT